MTTDGTTLQKQLVHPTHSYGLIVNQMIGHTRQQLFAAARELMELGLDIDELRDMFSCHHHGYFEEHPDYSEQKDEAGQRLLNYPMQTEDPWETCHPACRTTVIHMRKQIESAGGVFPHEDRELYDGWIASGLSSDVLVATIKHAVGAELSPDEQLMLAVAAHREYQKEAAADQYRQWVACEQSDAMHHSS